MLKTIKISEKAYGDVKTLQKALEKNEVIEGVYDVKLSTAVSYAIKVALDKINRKKRFLSSAGGWSDMEGDPLKEIYENRSISKNWDLSLD
tara:strand:- start:1463 stop:1735 length:273 start_codon:yes stop_codon:yes gene_type:complete